MAHVLWAAAIDALLWLHAKCCGFIAGALLKLAK